MKFRATSLRSIRFSLVVALGLASVWTIPSRVTQAQESAPLPVRKNALKPGRFNVGTVEGAGGSQDPIVVELRVGIETAAPLSFTSPEKMAFELCPALAKGGAANTASDLYVTVRRGRAIARFKIAYDGKACNAPPKPKPRAVLAPQTTLSALDELMKIDTSGASSASTESTPSTPSTLETPAVAVAAIRPTPETPLAVSSPPPATAIAVAPASSKSPTAPTPAPPVVVAQVPVPAATLPPQLPENPESISMTEATAGPSLSAAERNLVPQNLESFLVYLRTLSGRKDYVFVLKFRNPVNVEGVETAAVIQSIAVVGRSAQWFDNGLEADLERTADDPRAAKKVRFTFPQGMIVASAGKPPGVHHTVRISVQLGGLEGAAFTNTERGIKSYSDIGEN